VTMDTTIRARSECSKAASKLVPLYAVRLIATPNRGVRRLINVSAAQRWVRESC
jgi:hypothetical protein